MAVVKIGPILRFYDHGCNITSCRPLVHHPNFISTEFIAFLRERVSVLLKIIFLTMSGHLTPFRLAIDYMHAHPIPPPIHPIGDRLAMQEHRLACFALPPGL